MTAPDIKDRGMTNRAPWDMQRHDTMFGDLANDTSTYNATYDNFHYRIELQKDGVKIADVEDLRIIWHDKKKAQAKCRISALASENAIVQFNRADTVCLIISVTTRADASRYSYEAPDPLAAPAESVDKRPQVPTSKEPPKTFTVSKYNNEPESATMTIAPNKWLYLEGVLSDV